MYSLDEIESLAGMVAGLAEITSLVNMSLELCDNNIGTKGGELIGIALSGLKQLQLLHLDLS